MSFVVHRVTKSAARYTDAGGREKCGYCRFFVPPRSCGKVIGPVSPAGWCKHFSRQMVSQFGGSTVTSGIPAGATLALDFMSSGTMPAGVTFSRASTGTYTDSTGTIQTAAINAPRWDYVGGVLRGLLIEEARTNLFLNSATLVTQGVTVTATAYTLSFYGTGTITKSGAATGALVGTGAGQRVSQTFTATAGTLTCTVTGSVTNAQVEAGSFITSWIPTTGTSASRALDAPVISGGAWFSPTFGSWRAEFIKFDVDTNPRRILQINSVGNNPTPVFVDGAPGVAGQWNGGTPVEDVVVVAPNVVTKVTTTYDNPGTGRISTNGSAVVSGVMVPGGYPAGGYAIFQTGTPTQSSSGYIRNITYWPRVLTDAEMRS
jgi:hypothetical protein